jgi:K+-transporting ATPase KdpF subunit
METNFELIITLTAAAALIAYLIYALIKPEKF